MSSEDMEHKQLFRAVASHASLPALANGEEAAGGGPDADGSTDGGFSYGAVASPGPQPASPLSPRRLAGDVIRFNRVALDAPDGTPLVRQYATATGLCYPASSDCQHTLSPSLSLSLSPSLSLPSSLSLSLLLFSLLSRK